MNDLLGANVEELYDQYNAVCPTDNLSESNLYTGIRKSKIYTLSVAKNSEPTNRPPTST